MLNGKKVLITGGTGSFGRRLVARLLEQFPDISRLVVFSRDELKQYDMEQEYSVRKFPALRYFIGDVRERGRLTRAFRGIDIVIHAAALKQVPAAEYNPLEFIRTNVTGAENVIEAAIDAKVKVVISLSTDKAAAPINLYGATKLCSDKLFGAAAQYAGNQTRFSVVRYGNVLGSRGSVIPFFLNQAKTGPLSITDERMTRFSISLDAGIDLVLWAIEHAFGGEIVVPKIPSYKILDVAEAIAPGAERKFVGIRSGEKLHEDLITSSDSLNTVALQDKFIILKNRNGEQEQYYVKKLGAKFVPSEFNYNSALNDSFLSIKDIQSEIIKHVDSSFYPVNFPLTE
ncbi:UDP-N-acetylglucosamine 4,6-dehydratase (inverting) [Gammaproteobacteria bacterium]|nr:UDP-N-acetylglucosamine 4,6-dehydratase (inverting) [Gammaproteobacteria bacterium]MDC3279246.1 UDP-N-acetylglucosamine 4,6-dehydratase (inverting) [Gammaproteobacteria bacterium]